jgi:predicted nucleic acid-binding protein
MAEEFVVLDLTKEIVKEAGKVSASLGGKGQILEHNDVLIAASAMGHGCPLKTGNVRHFRRIEGLRLV